jgi:hypothetical protein
MERFETYARIGGDENFRCIAECNLDKFDQLDLKTRKIREDISLLPSNCDDPEQLSSEYYSLQFELDSLLKERDESCFIAVVFTAIYFEAFIYDYAASCLGDNYSTDHLDKLDFI